MPDTPVMPDLPEPLPMSAVRYVPAWPRSVVEEYFRLGFEAGTPKWLPIESAPKGRTLLIGYFNRAGKWRSVRGHYYAAETLESELDESGWAPEGWYEEADNAEEISFTDMEPTHWQFLPSPPAQEDKP